MTHRVRRFGLVGVVAASAALLLGCGGGGARAGNIQPGDMPSGETWAGVYFHPTYGYMKLQEQDTTVMGRWKRADQSACGQLDGTKVGNVLHFTWKEQKVGLVGPAAETRGRGVFVFKMGENRIPELDGQYGLNDDEVGASWHCVKQLQHELDINSLNCDTAGLAPPAAGKWK